TLRRRPGQRAADRQRPAPFLLYLRLPCPAPPSGWEPRLLLVLGLPERAYSPLEGRHRAQHPPRPLGLGEPGLGRGNRHLHPVADGRPAARPQVDRVSRAACETVETDVLV